MIMDIKLAKEIIDCLPKERTLYRYFKDGYAVSLLDRYLRKNGSQTIGNLRKCKVGKLLNRPVFERLLCGLGNGEISRDDLVKVYPIKQENYVLTLGVWGGDRAYGWQQASRRGANLVLQVNFNNRHDQCYKRYVSYDFDAFKFSVHPISKNRNTMA